MFNNYNIACIAELMERLGLKSEDIVIQDPKSEILSEMAKMVQHENRFMKKERRNKQ